MLKLSIYIIGRGVIVSVPIESEEQCEEAGDDKEWIGDGKLWFVVNSIKREMT